MYKCLQRYAWILQLFQVTQSNLSSISIDMEETKQKVVFMTVIMNYQIIPSGGCIFLLVRSIVWLRWRSNIYPFWDAVALWFKQSRESGFESSCCRFEALAILFIPHCLSSLSCINQCSNCSVAECFPEKSRWRWNEQVCQAGRVKQFEPRTGHCAI